MVGVIISLVVTGLVVYILLKKMKAQFVLFFGGLVLLRNSNKITYFSSVRNPRMT